MTVKERAAQIIEELPDEKVAKAVIYLEEIARTHQRPILSATEILEEARESVRRIEEKRKLHRGETPKETFARIGPWEDDRTAEEQVADIHAARVNAPDRVELL
jgi:hypothetical protein